MNQKYFKYESKNRKKIRIKDILMLLSIFTLCVITVVVTGTSVNKSKLKASTNAEQNIENKSGESLPKEHVVSYGQINESTQSEPKDTFQPEFVYEFIKPVDGEILKPFSPDELLYSETMDDWRNHMGVDISCLEGTPVLASESGVVKSVGYDINYGNTVTLVCGDYEVFYSSLSSDFPFKQGQTVKKGDVIGKSSNSCMLEICDEPHIHFEIRKSGINIDPMEIIGFN